VVFHLRGHFPGEQLYKFLSGDHSVFVGVEEGEQLQDLLRGVVGRDGSDELRELGVI
jgi:hypothetical protein